jgi:hypothetical protein
MAPVLIGLGLGLRLPVLVLTRSSNSNGGTALLAAIMPRIKVDKQTGINPATKSTWINGA